jgi:hypothetical protein
MLGYLEESRAKESIDAFGKRIFDEEFFAKFK